MVFELNNFLAMTTNLFASSRFAGIVLNGCSSSGGDLRSAVATSNARRFLTHDKSVAKTTLVEFDVVPVAVVEGGNVAAVIGGKVMAVVSGNVPSQAWGHEVVVEGDGAAVSGLLSGSNVGLPAI